MHCHSRLSQGLSQKVKSTNVKVGINNGQVLDHAVPSGFKYKVWLLVGNVDVAWVPLTSSKCLEYDLYYRVSYEEKLTPFELGICLS